MFRQKLLRKQKLLARLLLQLILKNLANQLLQKNNLVQVHLVHPGGIDTNIVAGTAMAGDPDAMKMFRTDPADVARAVIEAIRKNRRRIVTGHLAGRARFLHNFVPIGAVARLFNREMRRNQG